MPEIKITYCDVEIVYYEYQDKWSATHYGESSSLKALKEKIDKAKSTERKFSPPLEMWIEKDGSSWHGTLTTWPTVSVTSVDRNGTYAWVRGADGKPRKEFLGDLYVINADNEARVNRIKEIEHDIRALKVEREELMAQMVCFSGKKEE